MNRTGLYGRWAFAEFRDVYMIEADFKAKVESELKKVIDGALAGTKSGAKSTENS